MRGVVGLIIMAWVLDIYFGFLACLDHFRDYTSPISIVSSCFPGEECLGFLMAWHGVVS